MGRRLRQRIETRIGQASKTIDIEYFRKMDVYANVPVSECIRATGEKPMGVRWVDVSKHDEERPKYRPRFAAIWGKRPPNARTLRDNTAAGVLAISDVGCHVGVISFKV